jgi:hypothetical protein
MITRLGREGNPQFSARSSRERPGFLAGLFPWKTNNKETANRRISNPPKAETAEIRSTDTHISASSLSN